MFEVEKVFSLSEVGAGVTREVEQHAVARQDPRLAPLMKAAADVARAFYRLLPARLSSVRGSEEVSPPRVALAVRGRAGADGVLRAFEIEVVGLSAADAERYQKSMAAEDRQDIEAAKRSLAEPGDSVPFETVKERLSLEGAGTPSGPPKPSHYDDLERLDAYLLKRVPSVFEVEGTAVDRAIAVMELSLGPADERRPATGEAHGEVPQPLEEDALAASRSGASQPSD